MFEREIKFIYDFNLNKVKKTGSFLTYEQLLAADLHPAIMQYISAEIDFLIFEDRQKMLKNSVFDYSGGRITHYFNLISQEVKKSKRFSTEYISKLILHASSFTVNFLIRPKWSLLKFIFDEEEHKTTVEIKQILNYLYYYGYLKNILVSYLDKKKILSMNKEEFAELLDKIEKLGVETYLDDVINTALKSMAEFFNIGTTQKTKVPLPGIHIFLKEKKLTDHLNSLTENFGTDEKVNQEIKDIQKVLLSVSISHDDEFEELKEEDIEDKQPKLHEETIETNEEINEEQNVETHDDGIDVIENEHVTNNEDENELENFETENEIQEEHDEVEDKKIEEPIHEELEENIQEEVQNENAFEDEPIIDDELDEETGELIDESPQAEIEEKDYEAEPAEEDIFNEDEPKQFGEEAATQSLEEILEEEAEPGSEEENETAEEELLETEVNEETREVDNSNEEVEEDEPTLFGKEEFNDEEETAPEEDIETPETGTQNNEFNGAALIDMSEILENKNMTKIIENIFDYDMEDFANTIDMISECPSKAEALALLHELFENNNIKSTSKEAETFKSIISEYFDKAL